VGISFEEEKNFFIIDFFVVEYGTKVVRLQKLSNFCLKFFFLALMGCLPRRGKVRNLRTLPLRGRQPIRARQKKLAEIYVLLSSISVPNLKKISS
jgi:hypothetical protein